MLTNTTVGPARGRRLPGHRRQRRRLRRRRAEPAHAAHADRLLHAAHPPRRDQPGLRRRRQRRRDAEERLHRALQPRHVRGQPHRLVGAVRLVGRHRSLDGHATSCRARSQPGQYYLVQEAQGAGGTRRPARRPDATGTIAMAAHRGKVALVNTTRSAQRRLPDGREHSSTSSATARGQLLRRRGPTPALTNTTADLRNGGGVRRHRQQRWPTSPPARRAAQLGAPVHDCNADVAPSVSATRPTNNASDVPVGANVSITFSEPVDVTTRGSRSRAAPAARTPPRRPVARRRSPSTRPPTSRTSESCTRHGRRRRRDRPGHERPAGHDGGRLHVHLRDRDRAPTPIHDIQGAAHISPLQRPDRSRRPRDRHRQAHERLLDAGPEPGRRPGDLRGHLRLHLVRARPRPSATRCASPARVQEFRPGGVANGNLTTTELASPSVTVLSTGNPLPAPTVIGTGGRIPPDTIIEDDATGNVETSGVFDPDQDGLDFYESLEGMRVQLNNAVAVGPTATGFGETPVIGDDGANAGRPHRRGGIMLRPTTSTRSASSLDDALDGRCRRERRRPLQRRRSSGSWTTTSATSFVEVTTTGLTAIHDGVTREVTRPVAPGELAVATFNVENLDPTNPQSKFDGLAALIVNNLRSPDLIAVEEVQDNNGATDNGVVDASQTLTRARRRDLRRRRPELPVARDRPGQRPGRRRAGRQHPPGLPLPHRPRPLVRRPAGRRTRPRPTPSSAPAARRT